MTDNTHTIDTSDICLNDDLNNLVDLLAKNEHENWVKERLKEGWKCGHRDNRKKEHPCLVPYTELSESNKEQNRIALKKLLKMIIMLGYRIEKEA